MNLTEHLRRQMAFSKGTYGPGDRRQGVIDHIRKETVEVLEDGDPREWVDLVILSLDGLWRSLAFEDQERYIEEFKIGKKIFMNDWGNIPEIATALVVEKQKKNEQRDWPDWRSADPTKAIEHDRSKD